LWQEPRQYEYIGSLATSLHRFNLFRLEKIRIETDLHGTRLCDLFNDKITSTPNITRADKLALSAAIANGVLWVPRLTSSFDIGDFLVKSPREGYGIKVKRVFLKANGTNRQQKKPVYIENPIIFTLGIILIQICFGQSIYSLKPTEDELPHNHCNEQYAAEYWIAKKLLGSGRILEESGWEYESAVRFCIMGDHTSRTHDLDDEAFRLSVWENVVSPLVTTFEQFQRPILQNI
jgi:hypothetical protein